MSETSAVAAPAGASLLALAALGLRIGLLHRIAGAPEADLAPACPDPSQHTGFAGCTSCRTAFGDEDIARSAAFSLQLLPVPWGSAAADLMRRTSSSPAGATLREADRLAGDAGHGPMLRPILALVGPNGADASSTAAILPVPLDLTREALFPTAQKHEPSQAQYAALWHGLRQEVMHLRDAYAGASLDACLAVLDALLFKYTWSIPWRGDEGISLYEHLRSAAAIVVSLAPVATEPSRSASPHDAAELALLAGDLSGIQSFLYTLGARGAARTLRGRSLYLDLLCDLLARWLLRELGLPQMSLLYSGGGRFYILAPGQALARWPDLRAQISALLIQHHHADLGIVTGAVPARREDLARFEQTWAAVNAEITVAKRRRFAELPTDQIYEAIFSPRPAIPASRLCTVCNREQAEPSSAGEDPRCRACTAYEALGQTLAHASYLTLSDRTIARPHFDLPAFAALGYAVDLAPSPETALVQAGSGGAVFALNDTRLLFGPLGNAIDSAAVRPALGVRFLAQILPRAADGSLLEFGDLGAAARGIDRLGVLRMDVDDLGLLFGTARRNAGIAGVATLSRSLRLFFEGYLNTLTRQLNQSLQGGGDHIYSVYAGGDDLFIVGSWDVIPELALRIHDGLSDYAAGNPAVHISAGIAVIDTHAPIHLGADEAGDALDAEAKQYVGPAGDRKNAARFLGRTVSWDELRATSQATDRLTQLVQQEGEHRAAPRGLLQLLQVLAERARVDAARLPGGNAGAIQYGPWMWLAAYQLTRLKEQRRDLAVELDHLQRELLEPDRLQRIGFAARWAQYLLRSKVEG